MSQGTSKVENMTHKATDRYNLHETIKRLTVFTKTVRPLQCLNYYHFLKTDCVNLTPYEINQQSYELHIQHIMIK